MRLLAGQLREDPATAAAMAGVSHVEWWAHRRPPWAAHQLHFDANEALMRQVWRPGSGSSRVRARAPARPARRSCMRTLHGWASCTRCPPRHRPPRLTPRAPSSHGRGGLLHCRDWTCIVCCTPR
jgi:hypothetical protein